MSVSAPPPPLRPFSRPALVLAVALGIGILLAHRFPSVPFGAWAVALLVTALTSVVAWILSQRRLVSAVRLVLAIMALSALTFVGAGRASLWLERPPDDVSHLAEAADALSDPTSVTLWGRVDRPPEALSYGTRIILSVDSAATTSTSRPIRGRVQVLLGMPRYGEPVVYPTLRVGDLIEITGELRPVPPKRNPADFDYGAYLERLGIRGTMNLYHGGAIAFLGSDAGPVEDLVTEFRSHIRASIGRYVRVREHEHVLYALILADRQGIDPETRQWFAETGLMHLLAVSGLHVLLVGLLLYRVLKPLLGRLRLSWAQVEISRATITLAVLLVYLLVTGGTVSVQRAFIMTAVWIGATLLQRHADSLNTLGVAAVIVLLLRPPALFDVGFQLSFAAVGALVTLAPLMSSRFPEEWRARPIARWVFGMTVVSLAATLGTAPVLLYHFGGVPIAGLLLNLTAIPATAVALSGGLAVVLLAGVPWVADAFGAVAEIGAGVLLATSKIGAQHLGWASIEGFVREGWLVGSMALMLVAAALWRRPRARWGLLLLALGCLSASIWIGLAAGESRPRLDVVFLDVGQGDAAIITLPNGRVLLVDAGLRDDYTDQGLRTVVPHLRRFGLSRIDAVVLTHADADHYGGFVSVLDEIPVGQLIYNGHQKDNPFWLSVLRAADSLRVHQRIVQAGDTLRLDDRVRLRVLNPDYPPEPWDDGNDASVALRIEYGETSFLLTGDVEQRGEADMVARYGELLESDVVKVAHHGSRTSSTPAFVDAVSGPSTSFAIISVARRNRYGLPDEEPLDRWRATPAEVLQTAEEGAIWLRSDGVDVTRVHWR